MRKQIYSLLLSVLLSIPLGMKVRFSLQKRETRFIFLIISMRIISTSM